MNRILSAALRSAPVSHRLLGSLTVLLIVTGTCLAQAAGVKEAPTAAPARLATMPEAVAIDKKIITEAARGSEIMANLSYLSDMIGPRLTGSAALKRANEWTVEKMRSYGLTNAHLEPWEIPMGWERGTAYARITEPDNGRTLTLAATGWSPSTKGRVQADVLIMTAKNHNELQAYKGKLKDAIVLRGAPAKVAPISEKGSLWGNPDRPQRRSGTPGGGPGARGNFGEYMAFNRELTEFLRTEGAVAVLQDAGKPHGLLTTTGGWRGQDRPIAADPVPSLFVAHEHYALLHRLASRAAPARTRIELEVNNKLIPGPIAVYNTVAELRGSDKPEEFVVVGAHLDSWDLAQGTTDNGTGSCVVLEAARILARSGVKPKRTIRFVLFTGEEQGLYGSQAYVKQHKDEMPRTSVCLAHDTGTGHVIGLGLQGREKLKPIFDAEIESLRDLGFKEINTRSMGGSDHMSFEQVGVPGFAFQQDMDEYRFTHHSQSDTLDKAKEPDLIEGAQVMAVLAVRVANMPTLLPREKK